ncbi:DUF5655 domain-containing protein [Mycoplasmoides pirum]|uniref:DUF5655 domain-containing protein n=1 Tax=Mycoplasmoides pirum TaxID=2122 RepID=UPI0006975375|nr:DUF5655 domain-containing protein [Mycoplasmoides pirum]
MSKPILFDIDKKNTIKPNSFSKEKELQIIVEQNMLKIFNIEFLESEYPFNDLNFGPGRIDSLGIDKEGRPVIFEYKLKENVNVINQSIYYSQWLKNHSESFELLLVKKLDEAKRKFFIEKKNIKNPRIICIAKNFSKFDKQIVGNNDIQLFQYYLYGENNRFIAFELVNGLPKTSSDIDYHSKDNYLKSKDDLQSIKAIYDELNLAKKNLVDNLIFLINNLGENISLNWQKWYVTFKKNNFFASFNLRKSGTIKLFLCLDYDESSMSQYSFIRNVKNVGHLGVGDVEITIENEKELEVAIKFIKKSFEINN